jgi:hypothetical protein
MRRVFLLALAFCSAAVLALSGAFWPPVRAIYRVHAHLARPDSRPTATGAQELIETAVASCTSRFRIKGDPASSLQYLVFLYGSDSARREQDCIHERAKALTRPDASEFMKGAIGHLEGLLLASRPSGESRADLQTGLRSLERIAKAPGRQVIELVSPPEQLPFTRMDALRALLLSVSGALAISAAVGRFMNRGLT